MEQQIRFCAAQGGVRIAYATTGQGPALVVPPPWISHLEVEWANPAVRGFWESLARHHTVVRYDRHGCGLSDRNRSGFSLEADLRVLERVVDHLSSCRELSRPLSSGSQSFSARRQRLRWRSNC